MKTSALAVLSLYLLVLAAPGFSQTITSDFLSSPRDGGGTSEGFLDADWGGFSSRINVLWDKDSSTGNETGFNPSLRVDRVERLQLEILPYSVTLPVPVVPIKARFGVSWNQINDGFRSIFYDASGWVANKPGDFVSVRNERSGNLFAPVLGLSTSWLRKDFPVSFSFDGFISPVYFLNLSQTMSYDFLSSWRKNTVTRFSAPYLEYQVNAEVFSWVRLNLTQNYQRLDFQTLDWNAKGTDLEAKDDIQEANTLRLGLSLLIPIKDGLRLSLGGFWESATTKSSYWKTTNTKTAFRPNFGVTL